MYDICISSERTNLLLIPLIIHERMAHVLLDILLYDMLKCVFRHFLYSSEGSFKIERIDKTETVLSNILVTNDTGKWV